MKISQELKNRADILRYEQKAIENKQKQYDTELAEIWRDFLEEYGYAANDNFVTCLVNDKPLYGRLEWQEEGVLCFHEFTEDGVPLASLTLAYSSRATIEEQMNYVLEHYKIDDKRR